MSIVKDEPKLRQVAVLLTSVDTLTAKQLLSQFPTDQARKIRQAMVQLGSVPPEERHRVLARFRQQTSQTRAAAIQENGATFSPASAVLNSGATSPDALDLSNTPSSKSQWSMGATREPASHSNSALHRSFADINDFPTPSRSSETSSGTYLPHNYPEQSHSDLKNHQGAPNADANSWQNLPAPDLAEILFCERPMVIAIVLNQLLPAQATQILRLLPKPIASATLAAIPALQSTVPDVLAEIHRHLQQRLCDYISPKRAFHQGLDRLRAILEAVPRNQRAEWVQSLIEHQPDLAVHLTDYIPQPNPRVDSPSDRMKRAEKPFVSNSSKQNYFSSDSPFQGLSEVVPASSDSERARPTTTLVSASSIEDDHVDENILSMASAHRHLSSRNVQQQMPFEQICQMPRHDLAAVLKAADPAIVLLAMSGASDSSYSRIMGLMPARDVKRVEARLAHLGPIQLHDIDLAQKQIERIASQMFNARPNDPLPNIALKVA